MNFREFTINVPQAALEDLGRRLAATRWPDEVAGAGWEYGLSLSCAREWVAYWRDLYDWRGQEAELNRRHHFKASVDGFGLHFIRERGRGPAPLPLLFVHGWPGTFVEALKILPLLTDPEARGGDAADSFDVVVPSLPGYGFSDQPEARGMNVARIADLLSQLMAGLGYERFGAQGGDWGASVCTALGLRHAGALAGLHLNYIPGSYQPFLWEGAAPLADVERKFLADADQWYQSEGGYAHLQRTTPQTLAYGLNDSPAGLAAWILEKFRNWADCDGDLERRFTKDELLTNIMIYWVTQTIGSSCRLYYETRLSPLRLGCGERVEAPCGVIRFAKESPFPPRAWVERGYNLQRWTEVPRGGHFAAMEEPGALVEDIRAFFRPLR